MENPDTETIEKWRKDPKNWKYGLFYYNPQDPNIFAPKKIRQMGMTINFAHKRATLVFFIIISALIAILLYVLYAPIKNHL